MTITLLMLLALAACKPSEEEPVVPPVQAASLLSLEDMDLTDNVLNSHEGEEAYSELQPIYSSFTVIPHTTLTAKVPASATEQKTAIYPRIKKLKDGSYIMFYHGGQVASRCFYTLSKDLINWSDPVMILEPEKITVEGKQIWQRYVNPDAVVMPDGEIIAVFSFRDDNYSKGKGGGILIMRSTNNGKTFSSPQTIYNGTNWEPYLLLLPDGKLQCYFTDCTPMTRNSGTSVITSSDNGKTWSAKKRCSRQYKYQYDGENVEFTGEKIYTDQMPCFRVLNDGKTIAGFLEGRLEEPKSNQGSSYYMMSMVYNDGLEWKDLGEVSEGPQRRSTNVVEAAAGYISVFPSGETVISCNKSKLFSLKVGNSSATKFNGADWNTDWFQPFSGKGFWGSTELINPHMLVGAMHTTTDGMQIGQFYLNHRIDAIQNSIKLDGASGEWAKKEVLFLSCKEGAAATIRAAHDSDNLYLCIDKLSTSSMKIKLGSKVEINVGVNGTVKSSQTGVTGACAKGTTASKISGYVTEIAIPLSLLGSDNYVPVYAELTTGSETAKFTLSKDGDQATWQRIKIVR